MRVRRHPLLPHSEVRYAIQVRIVPQDYDPINKFYTDVDIEAIYSEPKIVNIILGDNFLMGEPEDVIRYIHRQVNLTRTQALVGVEAKFTERIYEDILQVFNKEVDNENNTL